MGPMRDMSAEFLQSQKHADQIPEEPVGEEKGAAESSSKELDKGETKEAVVQEGDGGQAGRASEHVEFLPVEWFEQVGGDGYGSRGYNTRKRENGGILQKIVRIKN